MAAGNDLSVEGCDESESGVSRMVRRVMGKSHNQWACRESEDLKRPMALGRYAALTGLSPEAFHSRLQPVGSNVVGTHTKGCAT